MAQTSSSAAAAAASASASAPAAPDPLMWREVWLACAGPFARLPFTDAQVYYFPRGHADQCRGANLPNLPHDDAVPCTVKSIQLRYTTDSDEPYAVISLAPDQGQPQEDPQHQEHTATTYYVKELPGTSDRCPLPVPKACAQELFPELVRGQANDLPMVDVHGNLYNFKHYQLDNGSHRLTRDWSKYSTDKKLISRMGKHDAIVFMHLAEGGFLIGLRKGDGPSIDLAQELVDNVCQAAEGVAARDRTFTVTYYPRQGWPFVVPRKEVNDARAFDWHPGMEVRMSTVDAHELDSSRSQTSTPDFFWGVITNVNNNNQWCQLQVAWREDGPYTPNSNVNVWQVEAGEEDAEEAAEEDVEDPSTKRHKTSDGQSTSAAGSRTSSGLDMKTQVKLE